MTPVYTSISFAFKKIIPFWLITIPRVALNGLFVGGFSFLFSLACIWSYFVISINKKNIISFSDILHDPRIVHILSLITIATVLLFIWAAIKKIALDLYDNKKTPFFLSSQLGNGILLFCSAVIIHCVAAVGYLMLIFPGTYMQQRWIISSFFIVDTNKGPVAALFQSWHATERIKRLIFWISVFFALIVLFAFIFYWYHGSFAFVKKIIAHQRHFFTHSYKYTAKISKFVVGIYGQYQAQILEGIGLSFFFFASFWQLFLASLYRQLSGKE